METFHRTDGSPAASTPVPDGKHVVSYFGSFGLVCYDVEGNELWRRPMAVARTAGRSVRRTGVKLCSLLIDPPHFLDDSGANCEPDDQSNDRRTDVRSLDLMEANLDADYCRQQLAQRGRLQRAVCQIGAKTKNKA
jgi:hypothetical protein